MPEPRLILLAGAWSERTALATPSGEFTYGWLLERSSLGARALLAGRHDLDGERVAFLTRRDESYVAAQWSIWRAGGIAVPLCDSHAPAELEYVLRDASVSAVVADPAHAGQIAPIAAALGIRLLRTAGEPGTASESATQAPLPGIDPSRPALMIYTSGTTGRPKGVVLTHANLEAQCVSLVDAWQWTQDDVIANVLPLHHVHGIVNVVMCALWSGARCRMLPRFDAGETWDAVGRDGLTLFMAVPTVYAKLLAAYESMPGDRQRDLSAACRRMRLMVSGSAALPVRLLERWEQLSGHVLLERYGMTEIGMALGNPLQGERRPGYVGVPMPAMKVRIVDDGGVQVPDGEPGEIEVMGPQVFREYWGRPEATREAFREGWFRTGDVAAVENGYVRILGRRSVDIIKSGGYKLSALEIEEVLREHDAVRECAVVGIDDPDYGERVCAAVVLNQGHGLDLQELRSWARDRLSSYKLPSRLVVLEQLPRNALGKVVKTELKRVVAGAGDKALRTNN